MSHRIFYILIPLVFLFSTNQIDADAYLADVDIHYGADSYKVNYEKEIITAIGNAYFKKQDKLLLARKIVIFYSEQVSRAECFGDVILKDSGNNSVIKGNYGLVKYNQKLYYLSGNVRFNKRNTEILSDRVYYYSDQKRYLFDGEVKYSNIEYTITSDKLEIKNDLANFIGKVVLRSNDKTTALFSNYMEYNLKNNDSFFKGDVVYQSNQSNNSFIVTADAVKYRKSLTSYYLMNNVFVITNKYRVNADYMVYNSNRDYLEAVGDVIVKGNSFSIKADIYTINNINKEINFLRDINGLYKIESR